MTYKPNLPGTFELALEIKLEKGLYLHNEGYGIDVNYGLPQPLKKSACIYVVTSMAETFFDPTYYQDVQYPSSCLPEKEGQSNSHFIKCLQTSKL